MFLALCSPVKRWESWNSGRVKIPVNEVAEPEFELGFLHSVMLLFCQQNRWWMDSVHLAAWEYFLLTEIYQRCLLGFNLPCVPQLEGMDLQLPLVFSLLILCGQDVHALLCISVITVRPVIYPLGAVQMETLSESLHYMCLSSCPFVTSLFFYTGIGN